MFNIRIQIYLCSLLFAPIAFAQENQLELSGGLTGIVIASNDSRIQNDKTLSADFNIERDTSKGRWRVYIEGNSSLNLQGVSNLIVESNADAGSALDSDRKGRVQISEINYLIKRDNEQLTIGLIDPSSYLDRSRITNDENVQFIGVSFVNNPTIDFPDYTLGIAIQRQSTGRLPTINAVLSSSNGIANNPNLSYSQLVQISDSSKGVFGAIGAGWVGEDSTLRLGVWINTRHHTELSGGGTENINSGIYSVLGRTWNTHSFNLRLGKADKSVSQSSEFIAVAYRKSIRNHAVGLGLAKIFLSSEETNVNLDDSHQIELYGRYQLHSRLSSYRVSSEY